MAARRPFHEALLAAGVVDVEGEVQYLALRVAAHGARWELELYASTPAATLSLEVTIDFPHPLIGRQSCRVSGHAGNFRVGSGGGAHLWLPS